MSFVNATLVLSIGETVEEVTDSGFLGTTPTLSCSQLGEDALVQVQQYKLLYHLYVCGSTLVSGNTLQPLQKVHSCYPCFLSAGGRLYSVPRGKISVFATFGGHLGF